MVLSTLGTLLGTPGVVVPPTLTRFGQGDLLHVGDGRGLVHVLGQVLLLLLAVPALGFVVGSGGSAKGETPPGSTLTPGAELPHSPEPPKAPQSPPAHPFLAFFFLASGVGDGEGERFLFL